MSTVELDFKRVYKKVSVRELATGALFVFREEQLSDKKAYFMVVQIKGLSVPAGYAAALHLSTQEVQVFDNSTKVIYSGELEMLICS